MSASVMVLVQFDPNLPINLACAASPYGIVSVLSHINREERPIAYASCTLNKDEFSYFQLDKEALAIIWLYGNSKIICRETTNIFFLTGFVYSIEFRRGKSNENADCLSCLQLPET